MAMSTTTGAQPNALRKRVYEVIEVGRGEDSTSRIVDLCLITLIILNVLGFLLETVPWIAKEYGDLLHAFNVFSVLIFTVEYGMRIWSCVEVPFLKRLAPGEARMRFAARPYMVIDLLAILPFYLAFLIPIDLRVLRALRIFRFLKLARYSPAMHTLMRVLINERKALFGALMLMILMLLFSATGIYFLENQAQPDKFSSIPESMWWAMATLTTVGYGDVSPITTIGKFWGSFVMILGLGMFALPIAIISTGFAQEVGRRDFVVTWSLMSRIPLLAELEHAEVASLMNHLQAHDFPANWEVLEAGSPGRAVFFIASGKVRVNTPGGESVLETGDFFGEIAMLDNSNYDYTFTTNTKTRLLELHKEEFKRLENMHPEITNHIRKIADARRSARAAGKKEPRGISDIEADSIDHDAPIEV